MMIRHLDSDESVCNIIINTNDKIYWSINYFFLEEYLWNTDVRRLSIWFNNEILILIKFGFEIWNCLMMFDYKN